MIAPLRSSFSWLDYSEHERRKMMDLIHAFQEKGTRDELGIGTVRDGLADLLFPGTGTVQTRARYVFFVPWIYRDLENDQTPSGEVAARARSREIELIKALIKGGEEKGGVIGIEAKETLQRLPSNIYWQGLGVWGIRRYAGSQDQYHRSLTSWYASKRMRQKADHGEDYADGSPRWNWNPDLPPPPKGWRWDVSFQLTKQEAQILRDGILNHCSGSLLAYLVTLDRPLADSAFAWDSDQHTDFPTSNKLELAHARNFSEIIDGAALLYNLLLARKAKKRELVESYRTRIQDWSYSLQTRDAVLKKWNLESFWELLIKSDVRISSRTKAFVSDWVDLVRCSSSPADLANDAKAQALIRDREIQLKKGLARLENPRALELWNEAAGIGRLDFRWNKAKQMANDVLQGLQRA